MNQASLIYFSPSSNTKTIVKAVGDAIGLSTTEIDLTSAQARRDRHIIPQDTLLVLGMPVHYGRLPAKVLDAFDTLELNGNQAVIVVTYGNREYDDALLELSALCAQKGMHVIAAGAFIGEHSFSANIAPGRPDAQDIQKAREFGEAVRNKLQSGVSAPLNIRGSYPYKAVTPTPITPSTNETCVSCMLCAQLCPVEAIDADPAVIDREKCILCASCIKNCPQKAKSITFAPFADMIGKLEQLCAGRKEPELFL